MPKRILIVDDNKEQVDLMQDILEYEGYTVDAAFDGTQGIEKALGQPPDLVLLDLTIPPKDGWDVCRQLKSNKATSKVQVIICTGRDIAADIDEVAESLELGVVTYLIKPVNIEIMKEKIKDLLK